METSLNVTWGDLTSVYRASVMLCISTITLSVLLYVPPSRGLSVTVISPQNPQVFILSGWSLAGFQRSGAWCPSTTPGFTKADARIAFGQSAPNFCAVKRAGVCWDVPLRHMVNILSSKPKHQSLNHHSIRNNFIHLLKLLHLCAWLAVQCL